MIRIVTDSSADLPSDLVARHGIVVVPLTIRFGDEEYVDGQDLDRSAFWPKLTASEVLPETAAPPAGMFQDAFLDLAEGGATGVVAVTLSSHVSGTYQSAAIAAEKVADTIPVTVADSESVSMATGFQVLEAARAAAAGRSLTEVVATTAACRSTTNIFATLDTLEFLKRGGRVGNAAAFFGSLLNVKPLITFAGGAVAAAGRARTRSKAVAAVVAHVAGLGEIEELAVLHGSVPDLEAFTDMLAVHVDRDRMFPAELGPVVGTHAGPGVIGVAYRTR
ncbi:MAG: DegV family protein [Acidimicrobiia bacterium]|nr:DegV family protein [Acidimicrobiia bacterium]